MTYGIDKNTDDEVNELNKNNIIKNTMIELSSGENNESEFSNILYVINYDGYVFKIENRFYLNNKSNSSNKRIVGKIMENDLKKLLETIKNYSKKGIYEKNMTGANYKLKINLDGKSIEYNNPHVEEINLVVFLKDKIKELTNKKNHKHQKIIIIILHLLIHQKKLLIIIALGRIYQQ